MIVQPLDIGERRAMYYKYAKLRDELGFSDADVSRKTDIPPTTIYDWKRRCEKNPSATLSLGNMAAIARLLNVQLEYFTDNG